MNTKKIIMTVVAVILLAAVAVGLYFALKPGTAEGDKTIVLSVVHGDGTTNNITINTDAEFLRGALEQENLIEGSDDSGTMYVTVVDGETADWDANNSWWCLCDADGNMLATGVDDTAIQDGDTYSFVYTIG